MRFVDEIYITVKSGDGGSGSVSFLHTHLNPLSGPDGGEGGKGGDVYFRGSNEINSLYKFSFNKKWVAKSGSRGGKSLKKGKDGEDLYIDLPLGTVVYLVNEKEEKNFFFEITKKGQSVIAAKGGKGGLGNYSFKSSTNRTPRYSQKGFLTKEIRFFFELRIIADIGFVGLPNAGKSTLLNSLTNSKSKIGDFEFTTINPQLGVISYGKSKKLTIADLPGIIEGSHKNKGLGFKFLKHISRCKKIIYILDSSKTDFLNDIKIIKNELKNSPFDILQNNTIEGELFLVLNKVDLLSNEKIREIKATFDRKLKESKTVYFFASSVNKKYLKNIYFYLEKFSSEKNHSFSEKKESSKPFYEIYDFTENKINLNVKMLKKSLWKVSGLEIEKIISDNNKKDYDFDKNVSKLFENLSVEKILYGEGVKKGDYLLIDNKKYLWK